MKRFGDSHMKLILQFPGVRISVFDDDDSNVGKAISRSMVCNFDDLSKTCHPRQIALGGFATGPNYGLSHWGGDHGPFDETSPQGDLNAAR